MRDQVGLMARSLCPLRRPKNEPCGVIGHGIRVMPRLVDGLASRGPLVDRLRGNRLQGAGGREKLVYRCNGNWTPESAFIGLFACGDLLNHVDDAAAKLGIGDAGESASQCEAFGGREEVGDIGWRWPLRRSLRY